jgi:hypothetical protein
MATTKRRRKAAPKPLVETKRTRGASTYVPVKLKADEVDALDRLVGKLKLPNGRSGVLRYALRVLVEAETTGVAGVAGVAFPPSAD